VPARPIAKIKPKPIATYGFIPTPLGSITLSRKPKSAGETDQSNKRVCNARLDKISIQKAGVPYQRYIRQLLESSIARTK
jgi:hypothetical protein